jgi:AcrR family transcriptional regulator
MAAPRKKQARTRQDPGEVRQRILDTFSERAKRSGIRGIVMAELLQELRMSASTLYHHFPSKDELVIACVERWASDIAADAFVGKPSTDERVIYDGLIAWAEGWSEAQARFSPAFISDLRRDYPKAWEIFQRHLKTSKRQGAALLTPGLKPGMRPDIALTLLDLILTRITDPELPDRLRVSRHELIRTAIAIWGSGALRGQGKSSPAAEAPRARRGAARVPSPGRRRG